MSNDKDKISVTVATAVGLGAIIGAGIYVLSGTAIALAGAYALIAFVLVGIVAFIIALELGELGSLMPYVKGASYSYTYKAFGSELGFIAGLLRYFSLATAISVISLGFASYLSNFLGVAVGTYAIPFAILLITVLSIVNLLGIKKAAEADFGLVIIKIAILLIFVAFAVFVAVTGVRGGIPQISFSAPGSAVGGIFAASVVVFFAYSGFQAISSITDRIKGGSSGYVKAILSAVTISIILYLLVVSALLLLLPSSAYKISADPLAYALKGSVAPPWIGILVDFGALVATASATIAMILASSRALYQMSSDHLLPRFLRKFNNKSGVAENGILVSAVIGVLMLFTGNIYVIVSIANFGLMLNYLFVGFDIIHFRRSGVKSDFRMPFYPYLPFIGIILLLAFFAGMPNEALVVGVILLIALLVTYYFLREADEKKVVRVKLFK
jgi:APA family basic amino acid/polyamine antiporter